MIKKDIFELGSLNATALVGWQSHFENSVYECGYILSHKECADLAVEKCVEGAPQDILVYAIIFCYCQYIELTLKNICRQKMKEDEYKKFVKKTSHSLEKCWKKTKKYLDYLNIEDVAYMENVIKDFVELDPSSFNFRDVDNKNGKLSLTNKTSNAKRLSINLVNLKENIDKYDDIIFNTYN